LSLSSVIWDLYSPQNVVNQEKLTTDKSLPSEKQFSKTLKHDYTSVTSGPDEHTTNLSKSTTQIVEDKAASDTEQDYSVC